LAAEIDAVFSQLSADSVIERLEAAQIANARVNSLADVWAHPQLQARARWRDVESSAGPLPALLPPGRNSAFDYRMDPIPLVGEHTQAILQELGLGPL
jgi:crotonobetainyl-CoA:carnitine CoA-transferase CaiB-like acyl-CoA transferase